MGTVSNVTSYLQSKATIHKMVEAMSKEEADYLLYLILEHGDFDLED